MGIEFFPIKRGDFWSFSPSIITLNERFLSRVKKSEGCWEWQGRLHEKGYGQMEFKKRKDHPGKKVNRKKFMIRAHRVSWMLHRGKIPNGVHVLHTCDNRKCVRPDHLFLGKDVDNHADAVKKGRKGNVGGHFAPTEIVQRSIKLSLERI